MKQDNVLAKNIYLYCLLSFVLGVFSLPSVSVAQTIPDGVSIPGIIGDIQEQISTEIYPQIPKPFEEVTITVSAYGTDLNRATLVWTYNGKEALKGTGATEFKFTTGAVGTQNNVVLKITPTSGPVITKTYSFTPAEVDVLWQAKTYTPPFYKGKALFTPEADVTFVAIPNMIQGGKQVASNQAVYTWKVDRRVEGSKSGFGKNTFDYTGSIILKPHLIQAETYSQADSKNKAIGGVTMNALDPQAIVYQSHPLYGILFNHAITGNFYLTKTEDQLAVFPYYFSTVNKNSFVTYTWRLNDLKIDSPSYESIMTFRKEADQSGQAAVSVLLNSSSKILQQASAQLSIIFGSTSAFGR